ncbi:MAG: SprT family zinc-dependent metalloprotease [Candidatus Aminicenantales bacterium]
MEKIKFGSKNLEYIIQRGKRKRTVAIQVNSPTQVVVLAPFSLDKEKIREIVRKKAKWIIEKQKHLKKLELLSPKKEFTSGEQVLFLGRRYRLKILNSAERQPGKLEFIGRRVIITVDSHLAPENRKDVIKNTLMEWYFTEAGRIITERINRYSHIIEISPKKIKIRNQQKRWGSCSQSGVLRFNWRIIMAPISIIDYVAVHELCHLKIKNHSQKFWKLVSLAIPNYRKRREWLKLNSPMFYL